jgi:hypothetical protein
VLRRGSIAAPLLIDDHVIVLARQLGDKLAISATNNTEADRAVSFELPLGTKVSSFTDALTGASVNAVKGQLTISVPALFGTLLLSQ